MPRREVRRQHGTAQPDLLAVVQASIVGCRRSQPIAEEVIAVAAAVDPGESASLPRGSAHRWWNEGDEPIDSSE